MNTTRVYGNGSEHNGVGWKIGVGVGVGVTVAAVVVVAIVAISVLLFLRYRRNQATLRRRTTTRTGSTVWTLDGSQVHAATDYRKSRDPFQERAGDKIENVKGLTAPGPGIGDIEAKAYNPAMGVPPPPIRNA